jgi:hypothetical protein
MQYNNRTNKQFPKFIELTFTNVHHADAAGITEIHTTTYN